MTNKCIWFLIEGFFYGFQQIFWSTVIEMYFVHMLNISAYIEEYLVVKISLGFFAIWWNMEGHAMLPLCKQYFYSYLQYYKWGMKKKYWV